MLSYQTRSGSPQGKPRVYFCSHPEDAVRYKEIAAEILACKDCAVWQGEGEEHELQEMQLFVMPVTTALLREENRGMAEFRFAVEHHIPVLPLLLESGLEGVFNRKCGALQYLARSDSKAYTEKLDRFLDAVLVSNDLAERVRKAFDGYIFLSYRKKDRKAARELMSLIHRQELCRDIAIWYDEFLTPGENFNREIAEALEKSCLFVMAVTPHLLERGNYVQRIEYPMARKQNKRILPVEMELLFGRSLKWRYRKIPELVQIEALDVALQAGLEGVPCRVADDAEHRYLIGLAYRDGIDVEVNRNRAVELITSAAEEGLEEAILELIDMYSNGKGVELSQTEALVWRQKLVALRVDAYQREKTFDTADECYRAIEKMLSGLLEIGRFSEIVSREKELVAFVSEMLQVEVCYRTERNAANVYLHLERAYRSLKDYENARRCAVCYREGMLKITDPEKQKEVQWCVAISYSDQGALELAAGNREAAVEFYEKSLQQERALREEYGDELVSSLARTLFYLSSLYCEAKDVSKTRIYLEELTALCETYALHPELETISLAILYRWGEVMSMEGKDEEAFDYYRRGYRRAVEFLEKRRTVLALRNASTFTSSYAELVKKREGDAAARDLFWEALLYSGELCGITDQYRNSYIYDLKNMAKVAEKLGEDEVLQQCWESYLAVADPHDLSRRSALYDLGCAMRRKGEYDKAREYFTEYLQMAVKEAEKEENVEALYRQVCGMERLGDLALDQGDLADARRYFEKCLTLWEILVEKDHQRFHKKVGNTHLRLGNTLRKQKEWEGAAEQYRLALVIDEEYEKHDVAGDRCFDLADLCSGAEREAYLRRALEHYRGGKETRYYRVQRGRVCLELAKMLQQKEAEAARPLFHESCELLREAVEEPPQRVDLRNLATAYCDMGNFLHDQKEDSVADWYLQEALLLRKRIVSLWGENETETARQAALLCYLGNVHKGERREQYYLQSLELYEALAAAYPEKQIYKNNIAALQK